MDKQGILEAIKKIREKSEKRNFKQNFDLIINLRKLNLKKPEENVNLFVVLPHSKGKKTKVCALVDKELAVQAKESCDKVILKSDFEKLNKKDFKRIAKEYDYFIAQATLMVDVAKFFGKVLGPLGKMPNPKAGCIVPPNADLKQVYQKLQKTVKLQTKNEQAVKCSIGLEDMKDEEIQANASSVYNTVLHALPHEKQNIKSVILKLTMGSPVIIGEKETERKKK